MKDKKDFPDPDAIKETLKILVANTGISKDEALRILNNALLAIRFLDPFTKEGAPPVNSDEHERILIPVEKLQNVLQKAIDAGIALSKVVYLTFPTLLKAPAQARSNNARLSGAAKLAADPKQLAKAQARILWDAWQSGEKKYKSTAAFARFVCTQQLGISSEKNVEKWSRDWTKQAKAEV
jgi:hypothetical protein